MGETVDEAFSEAEDDAGDRLEADQCQFYDCVPIEVERKFVIAGQR